MTEAAELAEGFKITEIGLLPEEWDVVRFADSISKNKIKTPSSMLKSHYEDVGKYPIIDQSMNYIAGYTNDELKILTKPLPVIIFGDHTRIFKYVDFPFAVGADGTKLIFPKGEKFNPKFLYWYFSSLDIQSKGYNRHFKLLKEKAVILPPLPEQQKIASVLSTIQEAKEKTENVINALKELKESMMKHLFTYGPVSIEEAEKVPLKETEIGMIPEHWEVVELGDVTTKTKQKNPENTPEWEFKYIDVSGINSETLTISDYKSYIGKDAPSRAKKLIETGDVIFATVRPTLKRVALIDDKFNGQICSTAFCVLRAKGEKIIPFFIYHTVSRESFIAELGKIQRGASYPAVTDTDVKNQKIPLPSLNEQKKISDILSAIDNKIEAEENKKQTLESLFKTLLSLLMTGKIRVKDLDI